MINYKLLKLNFHLLGLQWFKDCYDIRRLEINTEQLSSDEVGATLFCGKLSESIKEKGLVPAHIHNADETFVGEYVSMYCLCEDWYPQKNCSRLQDQ